MSLLLPDEGPTRHEVETVHKHSCGGPQLGVGPEMRSPAATRTRQPQEGRYLFLGSWEGVGLDNHNLLLQKAHPMQYLRYGALVSPRWHFFRWSQPSKALPGPLLGGEGGQFRWRSAPHHHPSRQLHRDDGKYFDAHQSLEGCGSPMHPEWENLVTH